MRKQNSLELKMERYLRANPEARKRYNGNRTVAFLLSEMFPQVSIPPKVFTSIVENCLTLNRYWRKVMAQHKEWHDELYRTKDIVEQQYELDNGLAEIGVNTKIVV